MSDGRDDATISTVMRVFIALAMGGLLAACNEPLVTPAPTLPSAPTPVQSPATPGPPAGPQTGHTLTGVVFEDIGTGPHAVAGGTVAYLIDAGPVSSNVSVDTNGRYTIPNLPDGSRIRVSARSNSTVWVTQACGAYAVINGDTVLDVELVRPGTRPATWVAPTLSGVVFQTAEGRRPVADTPVVYYSVYYGTYDVNTTTDAEGRYEFCGLPLGVGQLAAGDCNEAMQRQAVEIRGDTNVLDVDLTAMIRDCPR